MKLFLQIVLKDVRLLWRDRAALLLLFCMPAVLALIITLVQQNVFETTQGGAIHGILVDQDDNTLAAAFQQQLGAQTALSLTIWKSSLEEALTALESGAWQFCILIPEGARTSLHAAAREALAEVLSAAPPQTAANLSPANNLVTDSNARRSELTVYIDPTLGGGFKLALEHILGQIMRGYETGVKLTLAARVLEPYMLPAENASGMEIEALLSRVLQTEALLSLDMQPARRAGFSILPSATQQTLPAMAVFGIFFIVVPLAGALIRERHSGVFMRLSIAPVYASSLLGARLVAYTLVCLCQFGLIVLIGKTLLPWLGGAPLVIGPQLIPVLLIVVCIALAACGAGLLLGVLSRTTEQAGAMGPIAVVIAAALGGIMVPVFVMPPVMQTISRFSPLEWGHRALLDVLVRGADLQQVWPRLALLLLLFAVCLLISWSRYRRPSK